MTSLMAARVQMGFSLAFHIIFACVGIVMPFFLTVVYGMYLKGKKTKDLEYLIHFWSKCIAIFIVVGAISGTALSFELGLLWPKFMLYAGPIIGMPFSLEGAAFFIEAIALGIFLYGWKKVPPWIHWGSGLVMGLAAVLSAFFIVSANGWMNSPTGFQWNDGNPTQIDPISAMLNDAALVEGVHMVIAAFEAVAFAVCGLHAFLFLRTKYWIHWFAFRVVFVFALISALLQVWSGDWAAKSVASRQPLKLAAMEGLFETRAYAPLQIGGIPDIHSETTRYAIPIPGMLSYLAYGDWNATVKGLKEFPRADWPPVAVTHYAFQVMVGLGSFLILLGVIGGWVFFSKRISWDWKKKFLKLCVLSTPFGFLALEAGWIVTEVGRQPWIIYGLLKTADSVTPHPGIVYHFILYVGVYFLLACMVFLLSARQIIEFHQHLKRFPAEVVSV